MEDFIEFILSGVPELKENELEAEAQEFVISEADWMKNLYFRSNDRKIHKKVAKLATRSKTWAKQ